MTRTAKISSHDPKAIEKAQQVLSAGGLIVFPTDTLYGLGCNPRNREALLSIYAAKERSNLKALPVLIGNLDQLEGFVQSVSDSAYRLMKVFWPGALTLVLPKKDGLLSELTPYASLAVRMPNSAFALELLRTVGPLAVTSANLSGQINPQTAEEVLQQLAGKIDLIVDGGRLEIGQGSTIVDCSLSPLKLLREGPIRFEEILSVAEET